MAKRLIKVAKELNVGTSTIVDFLKANEFEIENKPTAKISDKMELMLQKEFQKSIAIKEKANQIKIGRTPKKEAETFAAEIPVSAAPPPAPVAPEVTAPILATPTIDLKEAVPPPVVKLDKTVVTAEASAPKLSKPKVLGTIDLSPKVKKEEAPAPKPLAKKKEKEVVTEVKQEAKKEVPPVVVSTPKPKAINLTPPKEEKVVPPKVKIVPKKETAIPKATPAPTPVAEQPKAAKPKPAEVAQPKQKEKETPPKVDAVPVSTGLKAVLKSKPVVEQPKPSVKSEAVSDTPTPKPPTPSGPTVDKDGMIERKAPELRGLKIKGKIDINKLTRPKKKVDSKAGEEKKKRKRTRRKVSADGRRVGEGNNRGGDNRGGSNTNDRNNTGTRSSTGTGGSRTSGGGSRTSSGGNRPGGSGTRPSGGGSRTSSGGNRPGGGARPGGGGGPRRGGGPGGRDNRGRRPSDNRGRRDEPKEVSAKEIDDKIKATMARLSGGGKKKRQKLRRESRERQRERQEVLEQEKETGKLQVTEFISVSELASVMDVDVSSVIMACMNMGVIVSINQRLDAEVIELVATEFEHEVEFISLEEQADEEVEEIDDPADLKPRAPIVTVMGHVDHGKTSLLDYIRNAKVADGEAGGITQHIGAYEVEVNGNRITFLDTPGHEAFTAMRARGAKVTDIAIIIVAADDNVMPQTREAISHAQAAGVPIVFAINKIDKAGANPDRIKTELASMNLQVEEWGGKYQSQDISAKMGTGIDELLEKVLLEAEMLELKANPDKKSVGAILEASLDKGRGYVTKSLIQGGTLRIGDPIVAGEYSGKVKAMFNEHGKRITEAGPSKPVLILGLNGAPQAGERFKEMDSETEARQVAAKRERINREQVNRATKRISLDEIGRRLALGSFKELNLIVKGDVDGSIEALSDSLIKLSIESVQVNVIHKAVGQIIESDVLLASASDAIIIGFQVRPSLSARKLAEKEGVEVKMYSIIYEAIEEIKLAIEGLLEPTKEEEITANVEIRETYKISKVGTIAGCYVQDGKITRSSHVRIIRNGIVVYPTRENVIGKIASLKRFKDDVKEAKTGMECGLNIENFNDIKVGDIIEAYVIKEVKQKLSQVK